MGWCGVLYSECTASKFWLSFPWPEKNPSLSVWKQKPLCFVISKLTTFSFEAWLEWRSPSKSVWHKFRHWSTMAFSLGACELCSSRPKKIAPFCRNVQKVTQICAKVTSEDGEVKILEDTLRFLGCTWFSHLARSQNASLCQMEGSSTCPRMKIKCGLLEIPVPRWNSWWNLTKKKGEIMLMNFEKTYFGISFGYNQGYNQVVTKRL